MQIARYNSGEFITTDSIPYQVDEATADTIYIRWEDTEVAQFIQRIVEDSLVTIIDFATGLWSGRAGLTYASKHQE